VKGSEPNGTLIESAAAGPLRVASSVGPAAGSRVWVALRPEKVRIAREPPALAHENCRSGQVTEIGYLGDLSIYKVRLAGGELMKASVANLTRLTERPIGWDDQVWLWWTPDAAIILAR
jgi:putrescine transport system ATP-binding protein